MNNILEKSASGSAAGALQPGRSNPLVFTKENNQSIVEVIKIALSEAQTNTGLNPKKAEYWADLAQVYASIPKELVEPDTKESDTPTAASIFYYKKAVELDPKNPLYQLQIGQIYMTQKKTDEGFAYVKKATDLKENWALSHFQLGVFYTQNSDSKNAINELELALANPDLKTNTQEYTIVKTALEKIKAASQQQAAPSGLVN